MYAESCRVSYKPMKIKTSAIRMMKREMKSEQAQLLIEENNN